MSTANFKIETSANEIVITEIKSGATFRTVVGPKTKGPRELKSFRENVVKNSKNDQYGTYINKFVRVLVSLHTDKSLGYKARFDKIARKFEAALTSPSVRAFSSNIRKVTNDGSLFPINFYFHEGKMKTLPTVETVDEFAEVMEFVQENDMSTVTLEELLAETV